MSPGSALDGERLPALTLVQSASWMSSERCISLADCSASPRRMSCLRLTRSSEYSSRSSRKPLRAGSVARSARMKAFFASMASSICSWMRCSKWFCAEANVNASMNASRPSVAPISALTCAVCALTFLTCLLRPRRKPVSSISNIRSRLAPKRMGMEKESNQFACIGQRLTSNCPDSNRD